MKEAVIVAYGRSPIGKAGKGSLSHTRPEELGRQVLQGIFNKYPQLDPSIVDDCIVGCSIPEGEQGMNLGRIVALNAGLPDTVSGQTINRFCSSGLQAIAAAANAIMADQADCIIAGGVECTSFLPMDNNMAMPELGLVERLPEAYCPMGNTAENVAREYNISREDMDKFAFESHKKAAAAIAQGKFTNEIIPIIANRPGIDEHGRPTIETFTFSMDESVRPDISMEALAKLPPVFMAGGKVTAGTSSQKNDAAAFVVLMSKDKADEMGINPIAKFCGFAVQGLRPEIMGAGPIVAIPKVLNRLGMKLEDIDLFELNEAFACQVLASVRALGIDTDKLNVNGGGIALGHPLGATGAYLTIKLIEELKRRNKKIGIVTMCVGGGMGAAGVFKIL